MTVCCNGFSWRCGPTARHRGGTWIAGRPGRPARVVAVFQRLNALDPAAVTAEDLTPEAVPFLRFEAEAQEVFDAWRAALEHRLRAEEDHPVLLSTRLSRDHAVDQMNVQRERGHQ